MEQLSTDNVLEDTAADAAVVDNVEAIEATVASEAKTNKDIIFEKFYAAIEKNFSDIRAVRHACTNIDSLFFREIHVDHLT